jgi:hypothetical protein
MQAAVIQKVRIRSPDPVSGFPHHDKVASFSKLDQIMQKWLLTVLSVSVIEGYFPAMFVDEVKSNFRAVNRYSGIVRSRSSKRLPVLRAVDEVP